MSHQGTGNGDGKLAVYRIFMAVVAVLTTMFTGLILFSLDARIDQKVSQRLSNYVEVSRYEREQRQHDDWSDSKVDEIGRRFDAIEAAMGTRTQVLTQIIDNQGVILRDLRLLKESVKTTP